MRRPRLNGTFVLLILTLVVAGVLAYQAWDAQRSQTVVARGTLREYSSFADWQFTQQAKSTMLASVVISLSAPASRLDPDKLAETLMRPEEVEDAAHRLGDWCGCLTHVRYFFRFDWADGTFRTTDTDLTDADLAWARDTVAAYVRSLPPVPERRPITFGSPDGRSGPLTQLAALLTNDSYAMLFGERRGKPQLLVFVVGREARKGEPVVVYGYATDPKSFLAPIFAQIHGNTNPLLPTSLVHDLPRDSILSISVTTLAGQEVYHSPGWISPEYSAADTIESHFGHLIMRVGIRKEIAGQLLVGGLPRDRLPLLIALFLLSCGLLTVALVQLRRQQELARLRTEFVSGVSHELRTPLAQIRWFAELLHMGKLRSEDERARSAGIIDQEARRLTYLVDNVLNFSRTEKGTNRISVAPADIEHEVEDIIELFTPLARARGMTLRSDLEPGIVVLVDHDALRQVVLNLLDNAVKYGPRGQTITVATRVIRREDRGEVARISVEDQGPGIPNDQRERVWEPYVRLNRSAEAASGGSGIGLAVVRELVTLHHGRVFAESAPGGGARFVVELPVHHGVTQPNGAAPVSETSEPVPNV